MVMVQVLYSNTKWLSHYLWYMNGEHVDDAIKVYEASI